MIYFYFPVLCLLGGEKMGELLIVLFILSSSIPVSGIVLGTDPKIKESVFEKTKEEKEVEDFFKETLTKRVMGE